MRLIKPHQISNNTCCHAAEYIGGRPAVWIGHGAPGVCALGAAELLPPGVVFAICPGDGEATPVRCPGGGDAFGGAVLAGEVPAGAVAGELAGDAGRAVAGEVAGAGEAACDGGGLAFAVFAAASAGGLETAAP